jgi:hypothetical protein
LRRDPAELAALVRRSSKRDLGGLNGYLFVSEGGIYPLLYRRHMVASVLPWLPPPGSTAS